MKYDIFVSYRRSDRELVASIVRRLELRGVAVWYDAEIEGGADWREVIVEALTDSSMLVIFFSEDANNSRQLKKELAVADSLGKPVAPILIEDTRPRGAYLYELADRHWIQAFPDPMAKIDELVEHLVTLAGKDGVLGGVVAAAPQIAANDAGAALARSTPPPWAAPAMPAPAEPPREVEQPLAEAVEDFIAGEYDGKAAPPKTAEAYVGHIGDGDKPARKLNDILPFKWNDLAVIVPFLGLIAVLVIGDDWSELGAYRSLDGVFLDVAAIGAGALGLFGAAVFPVRYFLRQRSLLVALRGYLISTGILLVLCLAILALPSQGSSWGYGDWDGDYLAGGELQMILIAWIIFSFLAFSIYGLLSSQRAMRSFRSNIRKI
jgi:hypothetical protein